MDSINGIAAQLGRTNRDLYKIHRIILDQAERIERLERIILNLADGSESSLDGASGEHTHWVYPLIGSKNLVEEIKEAK